MERVAVISVFLFAWAIGGSSAEAVLSSTRNSQGICNLSNLRYLFLDNNNFTGTIPEGIANLRNLEYLSLGNNKLTGTIPRGIRNLNSLVYLSLEGNNLHGTVPPLMSNCSLTSLKLSENSFTGPLPQTLSGCKHLQITDFRKNSFTGTIPSLAYFHNLRVLSLSYNKLSGPIPSWITTLNTLQMLDLSNNRFSGEIPSDLEKLIGFGTRGDPNLRSGQTLQEEITIVMKGNEYHLNYVLQANTILDLSNNDLTGKIPPTISSLTHLRLLNLSRNHLEGSIPPSIGQIWTLEELDLCHNQLKGRIPEDLSNLKFLSTLDVSFNRLCGLIPSGTQFDTFNKTSFQNNSCLCGRPLENCKQRTPPTSSAMEEKESFWSVVDEHISVIALALGFTMGFAGALYLIMGWGMICRSLVGLKAKSLDSMASYSGNGSWSFKVSLFKSTLSST